MNALVPLADHGELVSAILFVLPAFLVVGAILVLRSIEKRRDTSSGE